MDKLIQISHSGRLYTAEQTRRLDSRTIRDFGIDGFTLMELAASGAANKISQLHPEGSAGLYLCGKGNNAGDAIAVARYLSNQSHHKIYLLLLFGDDSLSEDTQKNLDLLMKCKEGGADITYVNSVNETPLKEIDYIVDGLFGTGLKGDLRSPVYELIIGVNSLAIPIYSMDLPSGLNADTGDIHGTAIRASVTFTFGTNKIGFYLNKAAHYTGRVELIPLPFPNHLYEEEKARLIESRQTDTQTGIQRQANHKYDGGVVHIVAGSEGLTGAAILAAKSAWKQGAGAVFLYTPHPLLPVYELNLPTIIKISVGDDSDTFFKQNHCDTILKNLEKKPGTLLIGPGIGRDSDTGKLVQRLLDSHGGTSVIDADALSFFDEFKKFDKAKRSRWILTPHIGEAHSYLGGNFSNDSDRLDWACDFADTYDTTVLLKGDPLYVAHPHTPPYISGYKTDMFNRAGFGDVLAGSIATKISITNDKEAAIMESLLQGYHTFKNYSSTKPFSPEDLI